MFYIIYQALIFLGKNVRKSSSEFVNSWTMKLEKSVEKRGLNQKILETVQDAVYTSDAFSVILFYSENTRKTRIIKYK